MRFTRKTKHITDLSKMHLCEVRRSGKTIFEQFQYNNENFSVVIKNKIFQSQCLH